ncbi:MAG: hypothetical protein PHO10_11605, partial [Gemmiger sp.]|nr:hypothetical protein [Gemmiger sp.]
MPSKRTNDSVDRIIEELNRKQADEGIRAGMNDQQVDEILRSIGLGEDGTSSATVQFGPISEGEMPDIALGGLGEGDAPDTGLYFDALSGADALSGMDAPNAPPPAARRQAAPANRSATQPAPARQAPARQPAPAAPVRQPARPETRQPARPAAQPAQAPDAPGAGDTTQTGVIKSFLRQAMTEDAPADSTAFFQRKEQFKHFFEKSVAVVPDENGKLRQPKKRRGLFGFGGETTGEITEEFVPINISMGKKQAAGEPQPGQGAGPAQEPAPAPRKKRGLFGRKQPEEALYIPEPREETPTAAFEPEYEPEPEFAQEDAAPDFSAFAPPQPAPRQPAAQPAPEPKKTTYYRSKYTEDRQQPTLVEPLPTTPRQPAEHAAKSDPGATLTDNTLAFLRAAVAGKKATETRKKPDTVEFTPGQAPRAPQPQADATAAGQAGRPAGAEPAAEPVMGPRGPVALATPNTAPPQPVPPPPQPPPLPPPAPTATDISSGFSVHMDAIRPEQLAQEISTGEISPETISAAADEITRTITGQIHLQGLDGGSQNGLYGPDGETGQDEPLGGAADAGRPGDTGATLGQNPTDTSDFVRDIAHSINTDAPGATRFAEAAQRLTEELPLQDGAKKPGGRIRLSGRPGDETEEDDTATLPFAVKTADAAHVRYEKGEDAPAVRRALEKNVLAWTVGVILAGVSAAVLLYLGTAAAGTVLPLPDPLDPLVSAPALLAVCLVLLAVACAGCWRTLLNGLRGIWRGPTPDTLPTLAALGAAVQLVAFLIKGSWYLPTQHCLFAGPAALLLCFNALGKLLDARTVRDNFALVDAGVDHAVAYRLRESRVVHAATRGLSEPKPNVLVSRPTVL